uniref:Uncharacterized protein n=1 Tax=Cucumis melo TaxID=3656 RepID=A0A9I9EDV0_CUCME
MLQNFADMKLLVLVLLFWTSSITFQLRLKSFSVSFVLRLCLDQSIRHCAFTRRIWAMCFGIYMNRFETRYVFVNLSIQELSYASVLKNSFS